jgi:hypothetical protein
MKVYTSCADCRKQLPITDDHINNIHDGCTPPMRTHVDNLVLDFVRNVMDGNDSEADNLEKEIDRLTNVAPQMEIAALWYVEHLKWPIFPLRPNEKRPATKNGYKDATLDPDKVRNYWRSNPTANIGLPTGINFDVIDIDVPEGIPSYQEILDSPRIPDVHGRVVTSSSGIHLYIKPTGKGNTAGIQPGIDYRGVGGYVVAPPSWLGQRGTSWSWLSMPSPAIYGGKK